MTDLSNPQSTELMLGEIRGQLRELIHNQNNTAQKLDGLTLLVIEMKALPAEVSALKSRVAILETESNRRDGAFGVIGMILKSPAMGWLVGAAVTAWAILTGRVNV